MRTPTRSVPFLLLALVALPACTVQKDKASMERRMAKSKEIAWGTPLHQPAPEIDGVDTEGKPMKLSEQRGKVVLLGFWAHF